MFVKHYMGFGLSLLSSLSLSFATTLVSYLKDFHPFTKSFWRFLSAALLALTLLLYEFCIRKQRVEICKEFWPPNDRRRATTLALILLRSLFSVVAIMLQYYSLKYMNLADSSTICYSSPIFVLIFGFLFLREPIGIFPICMTLVAIAGVVCITRPPFLTGDELNMDLMFGVCLAFASTITRGISIVLIRYLKEIHQAIILFSFGAWGSIQAFIMAFISGHFAVPTQLADIGIISSIGLSSALGQLFLILALKTENAGPVALIRTCDIVFAFIFETLFIQHIPDFYSILGGGIILLTILLLGIKKYVEGLEEVHPVRTYLYFLLK